MKSIISSAILVAMGSLISGNPAGELRSFDQLPLLLSRGVTAIPIAADTGGRLVAAWVGELSTGVLTSIMQFRVVVQQSGDTVGFFDSVTESQIGFPASWSVRGDTLAFDVPKIRLTYRGTLNDAGDAATGVWSQGGRQYPLTLRRQGTEYVNRNAWEYRPQRPIAPFPYEREEVTFENRQDSVTLAGTLTVPKTPGRHPVVVLISGSGPQDRDETLMGHKPFLVLADYLTRRGIAVLRYDDRGTAKSTGRFSRATTEDFARDAGAAVEFLGRHPRIDPKRIGLAGHSEGGVVAPMVTRLRTDVAFVVLLAATGVDGATVLLSQTETAVRAAGASEADVQLALTLGRATYTAALRATSDTNFMALMEPTIQEVTRNVPESDRTAYVTSLRQSVRNGYQSVRSPWTRFFLAYDPRPALRQISAPVLAISGSKDVQVLPNLNEPEIRKALTEGGNRDFEIVRIDGLNHLFQMSGTGAMDEYVTIRETFNPAALKVIGDWIAARTAAAR